MMTFLKRFNWISFASMVALIVIGAMVLHSAGAARGSAVMAAKWKSMVATSLFGLVLYFVLALVDYRTVLDWLSAPAYGFAVLMLVLVLLVGTMQFGGRRWLWFFQPSEISKLCVIAFVAQLFGGGEERFRGQFGFRGFLLATAVIGLPCALILMEPDLGTTLALVPAVVVMLLAAGVWTKGLLALAAVGCICVSALLGAVREAERPGVPQERREAIRRELLPPMGIMNDFIFCVWAEEMGYLKGSLLLLALFALLGVSTAHAAVAAADGRGRLLALGMATLVFAHVYVNIGMSLGLVPITGLPLPFLSLGRTFLVTVLCGLGLVQSVSLHREEIK